MAVPCAKQGPHGAVLAQEDSSPWFERHSCSLLHGLACDVIKDVQTISKIFKVRCVGPPLSNCTH